jgi:phage terminase large subunit
MRTIRSDRFAYCRSRPGLQCGAKTALTGEAFFDAEYGASFTAAVPGAFYSGELKHLEAEGRIRPLEIDKSVPVDTAWDLGRTDSTAIWFIQQVGREYRIVDYYESSGVAIHHYTDVLLEKKYQYKWRYGRHYFPADVKQKEWLSEKSRIESLNSLGIEPEVVPEHRILDRINALRRMLDRSLIDPVRCARGLEALRNYVREWSIELRDWRASPKHDWASHGADALGIFAIGHEEPSFKSPSEGRRSTPATTSHWAA